jgi:hypothetical protein
MKLSTLVEAGVSRRDFLKKTGASTLLPSLVQGGLPANVAKSVTGANPRKIFLSATTIHPSNIVQTIDHVNHYYNPTADDEFKPISHGFNLIKRLLGKDVEIISGPTPAGEEFEVGALVSPEQLASIMNNKRFNDGNIQVNIDDDEDGEYLFYFGVGDESFKVYMADPDMVEGYLEEMSYEGVLKNWWDRWGHRNTEPMSDKFFEVLKNNGIDPTDRSEWIKDDIRSYIEYNPEEYGDPRKYGIDPASIEDDDDYDEDEDDDDYDEDSEIEEPRQEPEDIEAPEDYRWASSMHQPFESKLARILGVL